jgi:hypothetical protein
MVVVAMRFLPGFQLPLAVLALMPMSLQQAASLSADAVTMAVSFVMTAYVLRLALADQPAPLGRSDYLVFLAGAIAAGLCKSNAGLVVLLLLIPGTRFPNRRFAGVKVRWLVIAGYVVLAFGAAAVWQRINTPNGEVFATLKSAAGIQVDENAAVLVHRPILFVSAMGRSVEAWGHEYLEEFVGKLGPLAIHLPGWIPWVYLALLFGVAATNRAGPRLFGWQRLLLIGIFLFNVGATYAVVWTTEVSHEAMVTDMVAGRGLIAGLQGRYLIPFAWLLLVAASGVTVRRGNGDPTAASQPGRPQETMICPTGLWGILAIVLLVNAVALDLVWNHFQARTSTIPNRLRMALKLEFANTPQTAAFIYDQRVVSSRIPNAMPFLVTGGARHLAPSKVTITSHGYKWPEDILLLSDQELDRIPLGTPLKGPNDYENQLVRRKGSSVEDAKVYLVRNGLRHWIVDGHWITSHGYKWPDDVHIIPPSELAPIPEGPPIQ